MSPPAWNQHQCSRRLVNRVDEQSCDRCQIWDMPGMGLVRQTMTLQRGKVERLARDEVH